jgi:general secretion pathway protein K
MKRSAGNRGAALLLVVLLVSLLAVLVVEFQRRARLELRTSENLRDSLQAHSYVRSGASAAAAVLLWDLEENQYDARTDRWYTIGELTAPLGIEASVDDLSGRFPLGSLVNDKGQVQEKQREAYRRLLEGISQHLKATATQDADLLENADIPELVDALVDWIDADDLGNYESYPDADYDVPNARLTSIEELRRVAGYNVKPEGYSHAIVDAILPYVDTRAELEVNVNTAPVPVLYTLHDQLDYQTAADLYAELEEHPAEKTFVPKDYQSLSSIRVWAGHSPLKTVVVSSRFRARVAIELGGVRHEAEAVLERDNDKKTVKQMEWQEGWLLPRWTL